MRPVLIGAMLAACASAQAGVTGFVQLRQVQRLNSADCSTLAACQPMAQELEGEALVEQRLGDKARGSLRLTAEHDAAIPRSHGSVREAFVDWAPTSALELKVGRQILTWGVSDYLFVNDVFPKNYDAFFTGAGFDRMKEPVDAVRGVTHAGETDIELVVSRAHADAAPRPERFGAVSVPSSASVADRAAHQADVALKVSSHRGGWDLAGYVASFRAHELRYFMESTALRYDRPRTTHLGFSSTGNFAAGLVWLEAALRAAPRERANVVNRHFVASTAKLIAGYSRELGSDVSVSAQWQLEAPTDRASYLASLASGIKPLPHVLSTLHLRVQGSWQNQTLRAGAHVFAGSEGDTHFNPFVSWSPADGWNLEGGANVFGGRPETRYGAFKDDSNVYVLARFSF